MTPHAILQLVFSSLVLSQVASANSLGLFPAGSDAKSAAIESAIDSREPQALLYNPSLLSESGAGVNVELGLGRLEYSYEHPQFDAVRMSVLTPVGSVGWRNAKESDFSWGLAVLPTSFNDLKIKGVPRRVDGKLESIDVETRRRQVHAPIGGSWRLFHSESSTTDLGFSVVMTSDERKLKGVSLNDGVTLIDMNARGVFFRPIFGLRQRFSGLDLGISYMHFQRKNFKGSTSLASEKTPIDTEQVEFEPAILSTGARLTCDAGAISLNVNRIFASQGRSINRDGISRRTNESDVHDVNHIGARVSFNVGTADSLSAAYAYLPTVWGAGSYGVDSDGFTHQELGAVFGTFNGLTVRNQAVAWRHSGNDLAYQAVLFRTAGRQAIGGGGDNPGYYQLEFVSATVGASQKF